MQPYVADPDFVLYVGDVLDVLRELPDGSVDCCVTSPPYWGLRDYGTGTWDGGDPACDHKQSVGARATSGLNGSLAHKSGEVYTPYRDVCGRCGATRVDRQIGLEATPELFVARMVEVFREVRRVLAAHGTCWINLGSSFHEKQEQMIPARVALALQADGWYLRSDIIWAKPNPMPESVTDRPTKAHEYLFLLSKAPRYYWDAGALREDAEWARWGDQTNGKHEGSGSAAGWIGVKSKAELTAHSTRRADGASSGGATLRPEVTATFRTDDGALDTRGWCELGQSKVSVELSVAAQTDRFQVLEPVGFEVGIETAEGDLVMHLNSAGSCAPKTGVPVAISRGAALLGPVWAAIIDAAATPSGAVLATPGVPSEPSGAALTRAEVVGIELTSVSPELGIAFVAFQLKEVRATLLVWGSFATSHLSNTTAPSGRNCRSVWTIATQPFAAAHFATFPEELPRRCIAAGCPEWVCRTCGKPRERIVEKVGESKQRSNKSLDYDGGPYVNAARVGRVGETSAFRTGMVSVKGTIGWSDCGHDDYRPGVVLDPFMGSGTTALVARKLGRRSIGIELNPEYAELCARRLQQLSLLSEGSA